MQARVADALAHWREFAPARFGPDYEPLRIALLRRDAETAVKILDAHGELDDLLPVIEEIEALERVHEHDNLRVVRTLDADTLAQHWNVSDEALETAAEFA